MSLDTFVALFLSAFNLPSLVSTLVAGALFGWFAFGTPFMSYSTGIVSGIGYARSTVLWTFLIGSVFYMPRLLNSVFVDHDPAWPRILGAYALWGLLCLMLGLGIWARLRIWGWRARLSRRHR